MLISRKSGKDRSCIAIDRPFTRYVIIRADLPLGFQAAQIVHAAGESVVSKVPSNTNAVVLSVKDEAELRDVARKLSLAGVPHVLVQEVDPPFTGQYTAIGVVPLQDRSQVKTILAKLSLLGARPKDAGSEPAPAMRS